MKQGPRARIVFLLILTAVLAFFSAGCWGSREVDEAAYVLALGLDRGPEGDLFLSMAVAEPASGPAGAAANPEAARKDMRYVAARAPGFFSGLAQCGVLLERPPNLTHLKLLVFSEELARAGMDEYLDSFVRWREFRRTVQLAVARGGAAPVIASLAGVREVETGEYLELMFVNQSLAGFIPSGRFLRFYNDYRTKGSSPLAATVAVRGAGPAGGPSGPGRGALEGDGPILFTGAAVFKGGRMIGRLSGEETVAAALMRGELRQTFITLPLAGGEGAGMEFRVTPARRPRLAVGGRGRGVDLGLTLFLRAEIVDIQSTTAKRGSGFQDPAAAEKALAEWVEKRCRAVFAKAQSLRADFFGFAGKARWLAPDWPAWRRWNWEARFAGAALRLKVEVEVDRTGLIFGKNIPREE